MTRSWTKCLVQQQQQWRLWSLHCSKSLHCSNLRTLDHCRRDEGYPDIITHGPFTALMLANLTAKGLHFSGDASPLKAFRFRGTQALYANRTVTLALNADGTMAEARNHTGQQAMTATREF